jgi:hypothetical protein
MAHEVTGEGLTPKVTPIRFGEGSNDWERWDLPTLRALHRALDESPDRPHHVRLSVLASELGIPEEDRWQLDRAVERLVTAGYIASPALQGGGRRRQYEFVTEIGPEALRILSVWPNAETSIQLLVGVMVAAAAEVEPYSPEEAGRMREVGRFLERQLQTGISGLTSGLGAAIGKALTGGAL